MTVGSYYIFSFEPFLRIYLYIRNYLSFYNL